MEKKKIIVIILALGVLLLGGVLIGKGKKKEQETASLTPTPTVSLFTNVEEPEVEITLNKTRSEGELVITNIDNRFSGIEYEVVYQSKTPQGEYIERGIYSGEALEIPQSRKVKVDLFFGTKSCTTGKCRVRVERVEVDKPLIVTVRLVDKEGNTWEKEKTFTFTLQGSRYVGQEQL